MAWKLHSVHSLDGAGWGLEDTEFSFELWDCAIVWRMMIHSFSVLLERLLRRLESKRAYQAFWPWHHGGTALYPSKRTSKGSWLLQHSVPQCWGWVKRKPGLVAQYTEYTLRSNLELPVWKLNVFSQHVLADESALFGPCVASPGLKSQQTMHFPFRQADQCICHLHIRWVRRAAVECQDSFFLKVTACHYNSLYTILSLSLSIYIYM